MHPHTKFRANRSIFCEIMTFRIFSRWLPSTVLNFEKFWINFRGRSQNVRQHTKFGQNRMIGSQDIAIKPKSSMAAAVMLNILPVYFLTYFEDNGDNMCLHTKFHANRTIFGERFIDFQDGVTSLFAILDHTRSRRGVPNLLFKFDFGILITFGYIAILVFCLSLCM